MSSAYLNVIYWCRPVELYRHYAMIRFWRSYAQYKVLENASTAAGASEGKFTPAQTIKAATKGSRSQVARGKGLLQDEADLSQEVLGQHYPDSGTAGRLQSGNLARDLIGGALSLPLELAYSPKVSSLMFQGGRRAKDAFGRTTLGHAIQSNAPKGVPAATRALMGPSSNPEPGADLADGMARGGLAHLKKFDEGGQVDPASLVGQSGEGSLKEIWQGLQNRKHWQDTAKGAGRALKASPSVAESVVRGAVAGTPGMFGDINDLIVNNVGSAFPNAPKAPTSADILKHVPRMTKPTEGSDTLEDVGSYIGPALGKAAKPAAKFLAKEAPGFYEHMLDKQLTKHFGEGASIRPQIFIGPKSHMWNSEMADKYLAGEGKQLAGDLWKDTGTARDPAGNLKQEISDHAANINAKLLKRSGSPAANQVLDHPELFANYPELERTQLGLMTGNTTGGQAYQSVDRLTGRTTPHIDINRGYYQNRFPTSAQDKINSTGLHEFQHLVQKLEGTPGGGSPGVEGAEMAKKLGIKEPKETQMHRNFLQQMLEVAKESGHSPSSIAQLEAKIKDANKMVVGDAAKRKAYNRLYGEAESRLTERRAKLTPEQRSLMYPFDYHPQYQYGFDVPVEDLITGGYRGLPDMKSYNPKR